jgi:hypothetical protein
LRQKIHRARNVEHNLRLKFYVNKQQNRPNQRRLPNHRASTFRTRHFCYKTTTILSAATPNDNDERHHDQICAPYQLATETAVRIVVGWRRVSSFPGSRTVCVDAVFVVIGGVTTTTTNMQ